jgi:hypothetical protein
MLVGIPCGFEAVADLETARRRLIELASTNPGEYFMFDLRSEQIVVSLVSASEESHEP